VTIPEFQDVGNQTSQLADAIAGRRPLQVALGQGQKIAQRAGENQKEG
jgi:sorbitol/mannitol transport system substrate-binding protein